MPAWPALTGAADALHVALGLGGWVEVDHMRAPVDVNSTCCDSGRDESLDRPGRKPARRLGGLSTGERVAGAGSRGLVAGFQPVLTLL
jgi:hypothetical protein